MSTPHTTIVYRPDGEFFTIAVLSPSRSPQHAVVARERLLTICFCGVKCPHGVCRRCGYETRAHRQHRLALRAPEDVVLDLALQQSLAQLPLAQLPPRQD